MKSPWEGISEDNMQTCHELLLLFGGIGWIQFFFIGLAKIPASQSARPIYVYSHKDQWKRRFCSLMRISVFSLQFSRSSFCFVFPVVHCTCATVLVLMDIIPLLKTQKNIKVWTVMMILCLYWCEKCASEVTDLPLYMMLWSFHMANM